MKKLYCIDCPVGCELTIIGSGAAMIVEGNKCPKGKDFAIAETSNPTRVLTTTVRTNFPDMPVIPVRTDGEIPRSMLISAMEELNQVVVEKELDCGDVVVDNLLNTGVSVIITSGALKHIGAEFENKNAKLSGEITPTPSPNRQVVTALPHVTTGDEAAMYGNAENDLSSEEDADNDLTSTDELTAEEEEELRRRSRARIGS